MLDARVTALFEEGRRRLDEGDAAEALLLLQAAYEAAPESARVRSCYGLCLALAERRFDRGIELCRSAAKQEFFQPEQYLNLARLHLAFGFKAEAIRYLKRGRMIDPSDARIAQELASLGLRHPPVLAFLPRRHPVNRWLGAARHFLETRVGPIDQPAH